MSKILFVSKGNCAEHLLTRAITIMKNNSYVPIFAQSETEMRKMLAQKPAIVLIYGPGITNEFDLHCNLVKMSGFPVAYIYTAQKPSISDREKIPALPAFRFEYSPLTEIFYILTGKQ